MIGAAQKWWTLAATLGMAHWSFGNFYEAVVFSPNWVVDSSAQMRRLEEFFVNTTPTPYFVPLTAMAPVLVWVLLAVNRDSRVASGYRWASLFALLVTALNIVIVTTVVTPLFDPQNLADSAKLARLAWQWNALNVVRMTLTAITAVFLFNTFRTLDRRPSP